MKKGILLLIAIMSLTAVSAKNTHKLTNETEVTNRYNDAVTFIEREVQFHVFLNGDFDFNTHYKNNRHTNHNNGVRIERDNSGRIRRVGRTFINYGASGNVTRIGSVFIDYRFGKLTNVGNLKIRYDRWNTPKFYGSVKYKNYCGTDTYYNHHNGNNNVDIDINIGTTFNYDDAYFYKRNFKKNYRKYKEDRNYFYYRSVPNVRTGKRSKILKRRKNKKYSKKLHHKKTTTDSRRIYRKDH